MPKPTAASKPAVEFHPNVDFHVLRFNEPFLVTAQTAKGILPYPLGVDLFLYAVFQPCRSHHLVALTSVTDTHTHTRMHAHIHRIALDEKDTSNDL